MSTNYAALGEYTAYARQAKDAASQRFVLLHNLGSPVGWARLDSAHAGIAPTAWAQKRAHPTGSSALQSAG